MGVNQDLLDRALTGERTTVRSTLSSSATLLSERREKLGIDIVQLRMRFVAKLQIHLSDALLRLRQPGSGSGIASQVLSLLPSSFTWRSSRNTSTSEMAPAMAQWTGHIQLFARKRKTFSCPLLLDSAPNLMFDLVLRST